jgi:hypothetical protein
MSPAVEDNIDEDTAPVKTSVAHVTLLEAVFMRIVFSEHGAR